jgi:hypothetical protein
MKTEKRRWRPSPVLVVVTTAIVVVAGTLLIGWLSARRYRVTARVEIAGPAPPLERSISQAQTPGALLTDGEVARTAARIREASGLLMGLSVLALGEQMNNRPPARVEALIDLMARRDLLPPGVARTSAKGALASDCATVYVRYRPLPLGVEVVSIGREKTDGPGVIVRLVAGADGDSGAALFVAKRVEGVPTPRPFAPTTEIAASGWSIEPLRERSLDPREMNQLSEWAKRYATGE